MKTMAAGPSTGGTRRSGVQTLALMVCFATAGVAGISGCSIAVPAPESTGVASATGQQSFAAPTVQAGHDAAAVAGKNMTFDAGVTLSPGVPVGYSDVFGETPGSYDSAPAAPEWTRTSNNVAGQSSYSNAAGCIAAYWTTTNQGPLIEAGDDRASTKKLFKYLIPSVVEDSLKEATLPWVTQAGKPGPSISFLRYDTHASEGVAASSVWARMLGTADTGLVVSLSCPSDELLAATTPAVMKKLSVVPPTS